VNVPSCEAIRNVASIDSAMGAAASAGIVARRVK
jgi:hypothetical protein